MQNYRSDLGKTSERDLMFEVYTSRRFYYLSGGYLGHV
jgi:hypothetical protein